ncbi:hypothetical protein OQA88_6423 [Cercophora sp. LCS_1]
MHLLVILLLLPTLSLSSHLPSRPTLLLEHDFPDPSITRDLTGTFHAFATASGPINIQGAVSLSPHGPWTRLSHDILPSPGPWASSANTWAPDVRVISPGRYVLYYSGQVAANTSFHCIGVATASVITGPYTAMDEPFACPLEQGGAIDPSGFFDERTGRRYVVYKVDGNAIGNGGYCNNGVEPVRQTPIVVQEVEVEDGVTKVGAPNEVLDRGQEDGPLVEAPSLFSVGTTRLGGGGYVMLYSNHCWDSAGYTVSWATAGAITGPWRKRGVLIGTGDWNLTAPGGATVGEGMDGWMVFHADCVFGRCMFGVRFVVDGGAMSVG